MPLTLNLHLVKLLILSRKIITKKHSTNHLSVVGAPSQRNNYFCSKNFLIRSFNSLIRERNNSVKPELLCLFFSPDSRSRELREETVASD